MRWRSLLMFGLPVLLAAAGALYLMSAVGDSASDSSTTKFRTPTKAESAKFHTVPGVGPRARQVPGSKGTEWEVQVTKGGEIVRTHGDRPKPGVRSLNGKAVIDDRIADKSAESGLSKALTAGGFPDADQKVTDPPEWRVDDWIGDGVSESSGGQLECVSSGPRLQFIYGHPAGWDRMDKAERDVNGLVKSMAATLSHSSRIHGGPSTVKIRTVCDGGSADVINLEFPKMPNGVAPDPGTHRCGFLWLSHCDNDPSEDWSYSELNYDIGTMAEVMVDEGYWEDGVIYAVLWDGPTEQGTSWGFTPQDDSPNPAAGEALMAMLNVDYWQGSGPIHEYLHNLGGVQDSAPHNYNGGHCSDGIDIMCYGQAADAGGEYVETSCTDTSPQLVDCGGDDYFNPLPKPGTYLANHRNTAFVGGGGSGANHLVFDGANRCSWVGAGAGTRLSCGDPGPSGVTVDEDRPGTVGGAKGSPTVGNVPVG